MKKTAAIFTMMLMLCSLAAGSLYVGLEGGVGTNSIICGKNYKGYRYNPSSAYSLSVPVIYEFNTWSGIESGITFGGKNYILERYYLNSATEDLRMNNIFIEVPLMMRFSTPEYEGFALYGTLGGYLGYWAWGQMKGKSIGLEATEIPYVDQKTDLSHRNRFEGGVEAELGCTIDFSRLRIRFGCTYAISLTDLNLPQEKGGFPLHNSTFTVGCGLMWRCI